VAAADRQKQGKRMFGARPMMEQTYTLKQLAQGDRPIRIGFFLVPDFPLMTFAAALDSLRQGNRLAKRRPSSGSFSRPMAAM
jgi:hypothetical protein